MTDRINSVTVVLDKDYRDDDCEAILNALTMVKGVLKVTPHVADIESHVAEERARMDLKQKLLKVLMAWNHVVNCQNYETDKEFEDQIKIFEKAIEKAWDVFPMTDFDKAVMEGK